MVEVWLPYGETEVCLTVSPENLLDIVNPKPLPQPVNLEEEIRKTLENPLNTARIGETIKPGEKVAIAFDKSMNVEFVGFVLTQLSKEFEKAGISSSDVTVVVGCENGKPIGQAETEKFFSKIPEGFQRKIHNPSLEEDLVEIGVTSRKTRVFLNKNFFEADFKILIGKIDFHSYAGFSGGRQTILSVCGLKTIHQNYNLSLNPKSRLGVLEENPVHQDLVEIANLAKINYIIDVIVDLDGNVLRVFSGNLEKAFEEGVNSFKSTFGVEVEDKVEIAVVSPGGHPFDLTFYDAQESLERAVWLVKDGGIIVLVAECSQGLGDKIFQRWVTSVKNVDELKTVAKKEFNLFFHRVFQLLNVLENFRVVIVSALPNVVVSEVLRFKSSKTVDDAVEYALRVLGKKSKIVVLPHTMKTFPILKTKEIQH
jgi:nickel-dependent lactate racemase